MLYRIACTFLSLSACRIFVNCHIYCFILHTLLQVFGHKLLAKDLDTAARYSKECDLDALTRDGDQVNRKGALFNVLLCTFRFLCVRFSVRRVMCCASIGLLSY